MWILLTVKVARNDENVLFAVSSRMIEMMQLVQNSTGFLFCTFPLFAYPLALSLLAATCVTC